MERVKSLESSGVGVRSYRDLLAWQKSMDLMLLVYRASDAFPKHEVYGLTQQLRRCVVSVPSNIAEGSSRRSTQEFLRFLNIACGSLAEVETQLTAARMLGYIDDSLESKLLEQAGEVSRILHGLYQSLQARLTRLQTLDSNH